MTVPPYDLPATTTGPSMASIKSPTYATSSSGPTEVSVARHVGRLAPTQSRPRSSKHGASFQYTQSPHQAPWTSRTVAVFVVIGTHRAMADEPNAQCASPGRAGTGDLFLRFPASAES